MPVENEIHPVLDPIAFAGALVLAPLLIAALFFWIFLIPVAALFFGTIPYLVFATPVLLWMVTRYPVKKTLFSVGGLFAHFLFVICLVLWQQVGERVPPEMTAFLALWGVPFAAAWCAAFAGLYRSFYRNLAHLPGHIGPYAERNAS
jgi:hypothetical protein